VGTRSIRGRRACGRCVSFRFGADLPAVESVIAGVNEDRSWLKLAPLLDIARSLAVGAARDDKQESTRQN
jgi:hypothetical protein